MSVHVENAAVTPVESPRRRFLAGLGVLAATVGLARLAEAGGRRPPAAADSGAEPDEAWLRGLTGKHRQFFDVAGVRNGVQLERMWNFYDAYREAYGQGDGDVSVLMGFHGPASAYVLNDAMYEKYALGKRMEVRDPLTGQTAVRNPFVRRLAEYPWKADWSIEGLQARGARALWCNRSLRGYASMLAAESHGDAAAVAAELRANVLPGVTIVPAMILAANRAQEVGCAYTYVA